MKVQQATRFIAAVLGASIALSAAVHAEDLAIAVAGPMTGSASAFGQQMKNGAEMAVADLNALGGVLGRKLALEVADDACDPKQARLVATKLADANIPFVTGHFCSSSSIAASEIYASRNVLEITPASTNPLFTDRNLWNVARVCGRDDQQGSVAGDYIAKNFRDKNIAILNDRTVYGKGLADQTKKALNRAGISERIFDTFNKGDRDFDAIVSRLKREHIDLVYVGGFTQEIALILRQMRDQDVQPVLMAADAIADREFASIAGPAAKGTLFTFSPDPRNKPAAKAIVEKFRAKNIDPVGYTLYAYVAIQVWSKAATKAGTTDPKRVMEIMRANEWDTALGMIGFDAKGDIRHVDYVVYEWNDRGGFAEIKPNLLPKSYDGSTIGTPVPAPPAQTTQPIAPVADRRVALVIGNAAYSNVSPLSNSIKDASLVGDAVRAVGFQSVTILKDLTREKLINALQAFASEAATADWAMIYYAGHGMEIGGINYLIPVDAALKSDRDATFEAIQLDQVLNAAERARRLRLVVLDACRDNPFAAQMKRTMAASRSVSRGLASVEPDAGTLVVYAAKAGETAFDGDVNNSPFATAFVKNLKTPNLEVRRMFEFVRDDVMEATGRRQQPFTYGSLSARDEYYFVAKR